MTKKKKEKKKITINKKIDTAIPNEIKILFGKFYVFSIIYIIFFSVLFPFVIMKRISMISSFLIILFLAVFYIYMIVDVYKKKKEYNSTVYMMLIVLVLVSISFSIVKFFF